MGTQKHLLVTSYDGLHCLNHEDGSQLWQFGPTYGVTAVQPRGMTPAVDQTNNFIYFQSHSRLWKLSAFNGSYLDHASPQGTVTCGNTVLVDDGYGYFIITIQFDYVANGGKIRCFDVNLDMVWEVVGLNLNLKTVIAYYDGVVFVGTGNSFDYEYISDWYLGGKQDSKIIAYNIADGSVKWTYECDPDEDWAGYGRGFIELLYCNGYIIGANSTQTENEIYILNATTGVLVKKYISILGKEEACAPAVLAGGRLYVGSLQTSGVRVTQIGTGDYKDWNSFGNQMNHNVVHADSLQTIDETPANIGLVTGATQGGVIYNGKAYFIKNTNCVVFDTDTLAVEENWAIGEIWDSTPLMLKNIAETDVLLIKENANKRVIAIDISDGSRLWNSAGNMEGNLFFGINYYISNTKSVIAGMTSVEILAAINDNFTTLNTLIADAATIITITDAVQWDDINANITSLNTEGVAVDVETITEGMTGTQFNDIINNFVTGYNIANS